MEIHFHFVPTCDLLSCQEEEDDKNSEAKSYQDGDYEKKQHPGYFRHLLFVMSKFGALAVAMLVASVLCFLYIVGTIILWFVGIFGIFDWVASNWKESQENIPKAMPGQEHGDHWKRAWELASLRNHGVSEGRNRGHFNVVPFLKSKTGLDMQHLMRLTKARDAKSKSEEELIEVDRKLPDAHIDLKHLSDMITKRATE